MMNWKKPIRHKKTITINLFITTPDSKSTTIKELQENMRKADKEIRQNLEMMSEFYKYMEFELEKGVW